ncbi:MAG: phospho-N-acetylmuramoyl-pentapeptide-transferase [Pontimonas sp.]|nr:phospho-N-acetylmuramoyl-pentapeptide-transferase [Pontimonas sp.]MDP4816193.1 phospho-N-acetylmuramoyl-pentapeptide-transferase [Pontimonas sp.]
MRILLLGSALALGFSLFLTPLFIRLFAKIGWGQFIRQDGPKTHYVKRGTPTMGGIVILLAVLFGFFGAHLIEGRMPSPSGLLVIGLMVGLGLVGFLDDFSKVRRQQSLGLSPRGKVIGQLAVSVAFAWGAVSFPDENGVTPAAQGISVVRGADLLSFVQWGYWAAVVAFAVWATLIIVGTSNAVNLTDGLDGLASGATILVFVAYVMITFWQFNQSCFRAFPDEDVLYKCYEVRDSLELTAVAAIVAASLIGFLWWNTSPAKIFMGDTGSLALGGGVAALALFSRTEVLLPIVGGLFVILTGSVILQRLYFKATGGRRIFYSSPLHHHYEIKGWAEVTIVVRFWLIAGLFAAVGAGLFYLEWLSR